MWVDESLYHYTPAQSFPVSPADGTAIAYKWLEAWSGKDVTAWTKLYSQKAKYTDHAFQIVRIGPVSLKEHWIIWRTAHPDFVVEVEDMWPFQELSDGRCRYSMRTQNTGTFVNDLPRKKASGKPWVFRACVDLLVDLNTGLIEDVEEWYAHNFERSMSIADYHTKVDESSALSASL